MNLGQVKQKYPRLLNTPRVLGKAMAQCHKVKIASLGRQEAQPAGTAKWPTKFRFGKILGTTSVVRSIENPQDVQSTKDSQVMISYK